MIRCKYVCRNSHTLPKAASLPQATNFQFRRAAQGGEFPKEADGRDKHGLRLHGLADANDVTARFPEFRGVHWPRASPASSNREIFAGGGFLTEQNEPTRVACAMKGDLEKRMQQSLVAITVSAMTLVACVGLLLFR
jgi:hypothetical protein